MADDMRISRGFPVLPPVPLPKSVQEIADVIGRDKALRLIGALPTCVAGAAGHKSKRVIMYVPKRLPEGHRLIRILGEDDARRLCEAFGGEIMYPANCRHLVRRFHHESIFWMYDNGQDIRQIAEVMDISVGYAKKIVKERKNHKRNFA